MAGKLMEKAGGVFKSDTMVEKGQQKRAEAGADVGGYGSSGNAGGSYGSGNTDSYGSGGKNDDNY
jgi:hypothetical protein